MKNKAWHCITIPVKRTRSVGFLLAMVGLFSLTPFADAVERPNVVWIISDDLSPELGCYGYESVKTPNLDRLAEEGASYLSAFSTSPVCSASRSALITGVYQTTTGTHHHRMKTKSKLKSPIMPITELMRQAGYFVCNSNSSMKKNGKQDYNFQFDGDLYDGIDWTVRPGGRKQGQPFFAQIQINEPHRDFLKVDRPAKFQNARIPSYYPEHPVVRADWANYLHTIETLDQKVGRVLERIERDGFAKNTVVFFFGDHGRPHYRDKQWLYDGGIRVPLIVRWPSKIEPAVRRNELISLIDVSAATVALAGVELPTWMQGQNMLGKEFAGRDQVFAARDRCGSTTDRIRCVRTSQFKYIRNFFPDRPYSQHSGYKVLQYPGLTAARVMNQNGKLHGTPALFWAQQRPTEELYDLHVDPDEVVNIADDETVRSTLLSLRQSLDDWIESTDDQGRFKEKNESSETDSSERWFDSRMRKRGLTPDVDPQAYLLWWEKKLGLKQ